MGKNENKLAEWDDLLHIGDEAMTRIYDDMKNINEIIQSAYAMIESHDFAVKKEGVFFITHEAERLHWLSFYCETIQKMHEFIENLKPRDNVLECSSEMIEGCAGPQIMR